MSNTRTYSMETLASIERFFVGLDFLKSQGETTITGFCDRFGIDKRNLYAQRKNRSRGYFEVGWLSALASLGIQSDWLLLGVGDMR